MMRTIAIENGEAKLSKQQKKTFSASADLLLGLQQIYHRDEAMRVCLSDAEDVLRELCGSGTDGEGSEEDV